MEKTKLTTDSFEDGEVKSADINNANVTTAKLATNSVSTGKISNGVVTADDLASTLDLSSKTVTLANSSFNTINYNVALLGFKMAVQENLTIFNLVDGVVDEFQDESGTDEGEGSNDTYCGTNDNYVNATPAAISAGFSTTAVTEGDTSTTGTNPSYGSGAMGTFTVPGGMTAANISVWGAAGTDYGGAGGGGFAEGTLAVTATQTLKVVAGEGGHKESQVNGRAFLNGGKSGGSTSPLQGLYGSGGGLAGVFATDLVPLSAPQYSAPQAYVIAGSGGAGGYSNGGDGGAGGGTTGDAGGTTTEQTNNSPGGGSPGQEAGGGGGDQEQGGQGGVAPPTPAGQTGLLFAGGFGAVGGAAPGGGGAGFYGGGGGSGNGPGTGPYGAGGGGSSYYAHPQITSGSTEEGSAEEGGGTGNPLYVSGTSEGGAQGSGEGEAGEDGYVFITGTKTVAQSTTIISNAFTAGSAPTTSRIVVFKEDVDSATLNTDIIASVSRNGGSNFSNVTLVDEGYVTGSSGQRILAGLVDISGQPSGTSMRWKLALANNQSKIHGVALSWG